MEKINIDDFIKATTHEEACELFLEMRELANDLSKQFQQIYTYAKSLELEKNTLINRLNEIEKK